MKYNKTVFLLDKKIGVIAGSMSIYYSIYYILIHPDGKGKVHKTLQKDVQWENNPNKGDDNNKSSNLEDHRQFCFVEIKIDNNQKDCNDEKLNRNKNETRRTKNFTDTFLQKQKTGDHGRNL